MLSASPGSKEATLPVLLPSVHPPHRVEGATGHLERLGSFPSAHVSPRNVDVWLPPGYHGGDGSHPVLYMHDGQNLFVPRLSFSGTDWGVDETLTTLVASGEVRAPIVVGVWNTSQRMAEYMPEKPLDNSADAREAFEGRFGCTVNSDGYLRFLVEELKPYIDERYRTLPDVGDTFISGSSMGGLISLYALCEYPLVFSGAACLSPSLTIGDHPLFDYLEATLPPSQTHKLYFDYGTEGDRPYYRSCQERAGELMLRRGFVAEVSWKQEHFAGHGHSEWAWRDRLHVPMRFLLGH